MSLFIRQDENRSELQNRIATELQERARNKAREDELPDGVEDSQFIKGTTQTTKLGWVWVVAGLIVVGLVVAIIIRSL
ncbi:MAG: hypothetical protein ABIP50_02440 [Candidatus Saccharimonadales bacterium]